MDLEPLRMGGRTLVSSWRHFGLRQTALQLGALGVAALGRGSLALDHVFARGFKSVRIERPTFIIGAPRSGTTFFHRLMTSTDEFPHWQAWELIVPSITARRLVRPLVPTVVDAFGAGFEDDTTLFDGDGHETSATSIEEEEVLFLLRMDTQFVNLFFPVAFDEDDAPQIVYNDDQPDAHRRASMRFFEACLKRQIHLTGKRQILAKMPYSTLRVRSLLETFPDARFVYMVRSPFETLRSHMTLHRGFFASRYGIDNFREGLLERYWQRRYRYNVALYRYFESLLDEGVLGDDQVYTIRFPDLLDDLVGVYDGLVDFTGFEVSDRLRQTVVAQAARQSSYQAAHTNMSLDEFGIDRARVVEDLGPIFEKYGFPTG